VSVARPMGMLYRSTALTTDNTILTGERPVMQTCVDNALDRLIILHGSSFEEDVMLCPVLKE